MELDIFDRLPEDQLAYLKHYGWNFSKKACQFAVNKMYKVDGSSIQFQDQETINNMLKRYNITLEHDNGYNAVYVYHMCLADFYGKSITDEPHLAHHIKCIIDDVDNPGGNVFRKWYADCVAKSIVVNWEDLI